MTTTTTDSPIITDAIYAKDMEVGTNAPVMKTESIKHRTMTNLEMFEKLMSGEVNNLRLLNDDALKFIQLILNKGQLKHFKITINIEQDKTLFEKITK